MSAALPTKLVEKPWGRDVLPAPFTAPEGQRIGEIWFEPPPQLPQLLVKYLFTSDKLSVQVHPSDAQLPGHGKEECWLVIQAEPDAVLGIGFRMPVTREAMHAAALDGTIEHLLEWHPVAAGDFYYIPAGTVHAIGAGVSLIEVQQTSEVTYRLYDYGRPRELHLDEGLAVALGVPHPPELHRKVPDAGNVTLVDGPLFRLDRLNGAPDASTLARYGQAPVLAIPLHGEVTVQGETVAPGGCALADRLDVVTVAPAARCLIAQPCRND
jgi:mannose-6-phosphate isomerase